LQQTHLSLIQSLAIPWLHVLHVHTTSRGICCVTSLFIFEINPYNNSKNW